MIYNATSLQSNRAKHATIAIYNSKQPGQERQWLRVHQTDPKTSLNHHIECYKTPDEAKKEKKYILTTICELVNIQDNETFFFGRFRVIHVYKTQTKKQHYRQK